MPDHAHAMKTAQAVGSAPRRAPVAGFGSVADADRMIVPQVADCNPGLEPSEYNVVVVLGEMPKQIGSILLADESMDRLEMAMQIGRILAVSPIAFNYDTWPDEGSIPRVGDIVWFAKHGGGPFVGRDDHNYRLIKDKDVNAVIERARDD